MDKSNYRMLQKHSTSILHNIILCMRKPIHFNAYLDSKVHGANVRPTWVLSAPGGPHVGPMNLAIWVCFQVKWVTFTWCVAYFARMCGRVDGTCILPGVAHGPGLRPVDCASVVYTIAHVTFWSHKMVAYIQWERDAQFLMTRDSTISYNAW